MKTVTRSTFMSRGEIRKWILWEARWNTFTAYKKKKYILNEWRIGPITDTILNVKCTICLLSFSLSQYRKKTFSFRKEFIHITEHCMTTRISPKSLLQYMHVAWIATVTVRSGVKFRKIFGHHRSTANFTHRWWGCVIMTCIIRVLT